jgi:hypothetical protein
MITVFSRFSGIALAALVCVLVLSCKDHEAKPSVRPLLVGKTWVTVRFEMNGIDVTDAQQEECETDNTTTFFSDGTFIDDIGDVLCEEGEKNIEGAWSFKANETIISFRPAGETPSDWNIVQLTEGKLIISQYAQMLDAEIVVVMAQSK